MSLCFQTYIWYSLSPLVENNPNIALRLRAHWAWKWSVAYEVFVSCNDREGTHILVVTTQWIVRMEPWRTDGSNSVWVLLGTKQRVVSVKLERCIDSSSAWKYMETMQYLNVQQGKCEEKLFSNSVALTNHCSCHAHHYNYRLQNIKCSIVYVTETWDVGFWFIVHFVLYFCGKERQPKRLTTAGVSPVQATGGVRVLVEFQHEIMLEVKRHLITKLCIRANSVKSDGVLCKWVLIEQRTGVKGKRNKSADTTGCA